MLRFLQERVNKTTKELDAKPAEVRTGENYSAEAATLATKQGRVQDLMRRLAEKLGKENDTEGGR